MRDTIELAPRLPIADGKPLAIAPVADLPLYGRPERQDHKRDNRLPPGPMDMI